MTFGSSSRLRVDSGESHRSQVRRKSVHSESERTYSLGMVKSSVLTVAVRLHSSALVTAAMEVASFWSVHS